MKWGSGVSFEGFLEFCLAFRRQRIGGVEPLGGGFRIVTNGNIAVRSKGLKVVRIGAGEGCLREMDGVAAAWFARHACVAALVRPDHYVYGVAADAAGLDRLIEEFHAALQTEEAFQ